MKRETVTRRTGLAVGGAAAAATTAVTGATAVEVRSETSDASRAAPDRKLDHRRAEAHCPKSVNAISQSRKVGPLRVWHRTRHGIATGKRFVDIPAVLTGTGRRWRKFFDNRTTAMAMARELRRRIDTVTGFLMPLISSKSLTFRETVERWREDEELRVATLKKQASTLQTDLFRLRSLVAFLGDEDIASISERRLAEYQRWRLEQGRKPQTINSDLARFSAVMHWAHKQRLISEVPKTERIPVASRPADILTPEEVVRIIEALPQRLQPIVHFLAETGCRKGEAINLTWDCVDEVNGHVEIRSQHGWTPKTRESARRIPLGSGLLRVIQDLPKDGPYVFAGGSQHRPIGNFRRAFDTAVRRAGITRKGKPVRITPHALRKAHATWLAMNGVPPSVLQDLLGHARGSKVTDQYYVFATEDAKRAALIELPLSET